MRSFLAVLAVAVAALGSTAAGAQRSSDEPLAVSVVRFYQPARAASTIEGVCEVRLGAMAEGVTTMVRYHLEISVRDSAGLELHRSGWDRVVAGTVARARGASALESFRFSAAPGRYRVLVRAVPQSGAPVERAVDVVAFAHRPSVSDLLLTTRVRRAESDTEAVAPGELRRAGLIMRTAPTSRLTPTDASLSYYAEVYLSQGGATAGELRADVLGAGDRVIVQTPPRPVRFDSAGGVTRGSLDLAGLPEGSYRLRLRVRLGDSTIAVEAPFAMTGFPAQAVAPSPAPEAGDLFAAVGEERLDSLYAPLIYLMGDGERRGYDGLTLEGRRRFLGDFWRRRDPTPETPDNPAMTEFYRSVSYTSESFREGGVGQIPGWRTDRGRIYLKNGRPDEVLRRPLANPRPYEVWKYSRSRQYYYVFRDDSGLGHFVLIGTNDRREPSFPEWETYLGPEGSQDVAQFIR
ncbi:MAG: GWxTD domain-containing protein [Gemmatimonadales bacterium]|nr:GWxTD domain-containing protein [Gemmatimonadales bacterium]